MNIKFLFLIILLTGCTLNKKINDKQSENTFQMSNRTKGGLEYCGQTTIEPRFTYNSSLDEIQCYFYQNVVCKIELLTDLKGLVFSDSLINKPYCAINTSNFSNDRYTLKIHIKENVLIHQITIQK